MKKMIDVSDSLVMMMVTVHEARLKDASPRRVAVRPRNAFRRRDCLSSLAIDNCRSRRKTRIPERRTDQSARGSHCWRVVSSLGLSRMPLYRAVRARRNERVSAADRNNNNNYEPGNNNARRR